MALFGRRFRFRRRCRKCHSKGARRSLFDVAVGKRACVRGFFPGLSSERQAYLQAYGVMPGYLVRILQQRPVTVVQVENMELAMEGNLARQIEVDEV